MQCELISIGDELLIGQVVNTNAAWLGRELTGLGFQVRQVTMVPDEKAAITETLKRSIIHAGWVFVTGGLGPTKDDMTKDALLELFGGELVFHEPTWHQLEKVLSYYGKQLNESHRAQCYLPSSAKVLPNKMGTAPGLLFESLHCKICVMPGVPFEMEHIMQAQVIPILKSSAGSHSIVYQTIATVGEGESVLSARIADIEDNLPAHIRIAYLPAPGRVRIRVTGQSGDGDLIAKEVGEIADKIASRMPEFVYAREDIQLAEAIGNRLRELNRTLSVAESCTGGFIGHLITSIPKSSDYFKGGGITYSNELKESVLGVQRETLDAYGAVSEQTVIEMARGALKTFGTDYSIAVSGIAGPDGGTPEKPVGTVWIAIGDAQSVSAKKFTFGKDRLRNIEMSAICALDLLRKRLSPANG